MNEFTDSDAGDAPVAEVAPIENADLPDTNEGQELVDELPGVEQQPDLWGAEGDDQVESTSAAVQDTAAPATADSDQTAQPVADPISTPQRPTAGTDEPGPDTEPSPDFPSVPVADEPKGPPKPPEGWTPGGPEGRW